jgi:hypothetical protein
MSTRVERQIKNQQTDGALILGVGASEQMAWFAAAATIMEAERGSGRSG